MLGACSTMKTFPLASMPAARLPVSEPVADRPMSPKMALPSGLTPLTCATIVVTTPRGSKLEVARVDAIPADCPVESVIERSWGLSWMSPVAPRICASSRGRRRCR